MNYRKLAALAGAAFLFGIAPAAASSEASRLHVFAHPPAHGLVHAKHASGHSPKRSANMTYHGGKILPTVATKAIFWGPSWANSTFVGDKISGLDSWYTGASDSNYAKTVDEYTGTNGQVGATATHQGHIIDTSTATGGGNTSAILNEVAKQRSARNLGLDPNGNTYLPVYVDVKPG